MIMVVTWDLSHHEPMPEENFRAAVAAFVENLPLFDGLQTKHFVFDPKEQRLGGVYLMTRDTDLEPYWETDYWKAAVELLGQPRIESYQVVGLAEAASGQRQVFM